MLDVLLGENLHDTAVVVSGDAPEDELRTLVEALRFDGAPEQDADDSSAPASAG